MWPIVRRFGLLALGVVAAWLVTVLVLNLTVFSAGGHVLSYLRAMESGGYAIAASKAGLAKAPRVLPVDTAKLSEPTIVGTRSLSSGELVVEASYNSITPATPQCSSSKKTNRSCGFLIPGASLRRRCRHCALR